MILVVGKAASSVDYYCFIVLSQNMHEGWVEQNKKLYLDNCLWNAPNSQNNTLISTPPYKYSLPSNAMNWNLLHKMQFDYIWFLNALNGSVWLSDRKGNKMLSASYFFSQTKLQLKLNKPMRKLAFSGKQVNQPSLLIFMVSFRVSVCFVVFMHSWYLIVVCFCLV